MMLPGRSRRTGLETPSVAVVVGQMPIRLGPGLPMLCSGTLSGGDSPGWAEPQEQTSGVQRSVAGGEARV